jgi:TetR/AcrR family transcriptional regulator, ethionamide resistance regulator
MTTLFPPAGLPARGRRASRPNGDDRERAILTTAEQLLEQKSLREISVDDLARGAGISRPTFYFYFPSKEAVLLTLLDRAAAQARATRRQTLVRIAGEPQLRWRHGLTAIYGTFRLHRGLARAMGELLASSETARDVWARLMEGFVQETAAAIETERVHSSAPDGIPARELAIALNWMTERIFQTTFCQQQPWISDDKVLDILEEVWLRVIYGRSPIAPAG